MGHESFTIFGVAKRYAFTIAFRFFNIFFLKDSYLLLQWGNRLYRLKTEWIQQLIDKLLNLSYKKHFHLLLLSMRQNVRNVLVQKLPF